MKKTLLISLGCLMAAMLFAQTPTTVYTPKGTAVPALIFNEMPPASITLANNQAAPNTPIQPVLQTLPRSTIVTPTLSTSLKAILTGFGSTLPVMMPTGTTEVSFGFVVRLMELKSLTPTVIIQQYAPLSLFPWEDMILNGDNGPYLDTLLLIPLTTQPVYGTMFLLQSADRIRYVLLIALFR